MIELKGKSNKDCKVFIDEVEESAMSLIYSILDDEASKDVPVRIMPDTHAGVDIVIGFTMPLTNQVNPNHIGVDIGCGVLLSKIKDIKASELNLELINHRILQTIPLGMEVHKESTLDDQAFIEAIRKKVRIFTNKFNLRYDTDYDVTIDKKYLQNLLDRIGMDSGKFYKSIGTLGGGNHYVELNTNDQDEVFLGIHSGSRNFGLKVAKYHTSMAKKQSKLDTREYAKRLDEIKQNTKDRKRIPELIKQLKEDCSLGDVKYLRDEAMFDYLVDMVIAQMYATLNRTSILNRITHKLKWKSEQVIESIHNYIDFDDFIIRKGAIKADKDQMCVIPLNMRDGVIVCKGKGNEDWNNSAPHGAGRIYSRSAAKKTFTLEEYQESMSGIYSTCINEGTIDESPMAYKSMDVILDAIDPTVEIIDVLKPILNIKAVE